ncbi:MAG: SLC13 family permease [Planctomycetota bacterium]|jgi:sodium-dependent dicarboxylate transporter 2/3/5
MTMQARTRTLAARIGLLGGPLLAVAAFLLLPRAVAGSDGVAVELGATARMAIAVMLLMAAWWLTEAIDIAATALLPLVLFPLLGVANMRATASPYASPVIFLFLGGFLLAASMQRWGLDRRIALLTLRVVGTRPANMVGASMLVTAVFSAFVSNTATAAMMLPIGLSLIRLVEGNAGADDTGHARRFGPCLMLGIAYAASIGGAATIIGTPPNGIVVELMRESVDPAYRREISFAQWLRIGVPVAGVFLPVTWLLLTRVLFRVDRSATPGAAALIRSQLRDLGPMKPGEWITFCVFCCAAGLWILRGALGIEGLTDAGIAIGAAILLFVIPVDRRGMTPTLDWRTARGIPWGVLLLFGGGLSLAAAVRSAGVADFLGGLSGHFAGLPPLVIISVLALCVVFLTEFTSNTATTATLVPILAALAPGLGLHPLELVVPCAFAASCAFMMPVATPPNAIIFASERVTIPQMCRAGIWLNCISVIIVTLATTTLLPVAFDLPARTTGQSTATNGNEVALPDDQAQGSLESSVPDVH